MNANQKWEQRWHPLRREWVVIAGHRNSRPWSGQEEERAAAETPRYVDDCYLCPGNTRVHGDANPDYKGVYVFDNDHPCVAPHPQAPSDPPPATPPYRTAPASGLARVICYHPRHDLRLARLDTPSIQNLLREWRTQYLELGARPEVKHVLIFENNGEAVGVSNPHPHCQVYATNYVFKTIETEAIAAAEHHAATGRSLLADMIDAEMADGSRVLADRETALSFVPHCARYAYETYVAPRRPVASIAHLDDAELADFADALRETLVRFDNLWRRPFPYVMALHNAPTDGRDHLGFHFHIEFHPPLRKPNLLKFLAGPEVGGGGFISDTWPEDKAAELREAGGATHYLETESA